MSGAREESFSTGAQDVRWNLDDLYPAPAVQRIDAEMAGLEPEVDSFAARFRGRIGSLGAREMSELLRGYEALAERMGRAGSYAQLSWATQSDDPARGALLQKQMEVESRLSQGLVFIDIEWANAPEDSARRVLEDPLLARWRHWLILSRRYRPHLLSEPEEKILREKSVTGRQAWSRFFDETHSTALYDWEGSRVPQQMLLTQLYAADRGARQKAAASLTRGLREIQRPTTFVANTILADLLSENRLRRYTTWISSRNMDNQVDDATVEALVQAVCSRYDLVARYYRLKKKLLGLPELFDYDRYAPLAGEERRYSWEEAREIVLRAYGKFDPEMARIASLFFEKGWIDAAVHPGKRGGAFCASTIPSLHPYVMLNYQGRSEDVLTLAHELGHGVHQYVSRPRGILSWSTPLTTAETASIFGETLVFHDLLARERDPRVSSLHARAPDRKLLCHRVPSGGHEQVRGRHSPLARRPGAHDGGALQDVAFHAACHVRGQRHDDGRLRDLVELHPAFHPHPRLRVRVRVRRPSGPGALRALSRGKPRVFSALPGNAVRGRLGLAARPGQAAGSGPGRLRLLAQRARSPCGDGEPGRGSGLTEGLTDE